jgi:hypothetical protein
VFGERMKQQQQQQQQQQNSGFFNTINSSIYSDFYSAI